MERRQFIERTMAAATGLFFTASLGGCAQKGNVLLNKSIGESDRVLQNFSRQGDDYYSFYVLEKGSFEHPDINGDEAYLYCENGKIIGYTIATDDIEEKQKWEEYSKTKFGIGKLGYKSDYGISFDWQKNNNKISISSSGNLEKNISEKIFYSEVIASSNLIMTN